MAFRDDYITIAFPSNINPKCAPENGQYGAGIENAAGDTWWSKKLFPLCINAEVRRKCGFGHVRDTIIIVGVLA